MEQYKTNTTLLETVLPVVTSFAEKEFTALAEEAHVTLTKVDLIGSGLVIAFSAVPSDEDLSYLVASSFDARKQLQDYGFPVVFEFPEEEHKPRREKVAVALEGKLQVSTQRKVWKKGKQLVPNGFDRPWTLTIKETGIDVLRVYPDTHRLEFVSRIETANPVLNIPEKVWSSAEKPLQAMKDYANKILAMVLSDKTPLTADIRKTCNWQAL